MPHDFELRSQITERYGKGFFPEDCTAQDWGLTWDDVKVVAPTPGRDALDPDGGFHAGDLLDVGPWGVRVLVEEQ